MTSAGFTLDQPRRDIVSEEGHLLVTGGPGCGKTTVALLKARERIQTLEPGQTVLFLSFSRAAVQQIRDRMRLVLRRSERDRIEVSTYHLFCLRILESHGDLLTGTQPRILTPGEERLRKSADPASWDAERDRLAAEEGLFTFDMFAPAAATILERCVAVRRLVGTRYPLVLLDEFQDTNNDQYRLVRALASETVCVALADPDQRIYEYQGNIDPARIDIFEREFGVKRVDLGTDNYRSPNGDILAFGDAILRNRTLPKARSVKFMSASPRNNAWTAACHAAVLWQFGELRKMGIEEPSIALLGRRDKNIAQLSSTILQENSYAGRPLRPCVHDVVWDSELATAAGQVIASVMEWPGRPWRSAVVDTFRYAEAYFRIKHANKPSKSALALADDFRSAITAVQSGARIGKKVPRDLAAKAEQTLLMSGSPVEDWLAARAIIEAVKLIEIAEVSRMLRLYRATDVLASGLTDMWLAEGSYAGAARWLRRTLDREKLVETQRHGRGLILMNMHKSKGKEFDGVVIAEPPHQSLTENLAERRLLRMAITRARHRVVLVRVQGAPPLVRA